MFLFQEYAPNLFPYNSQSHRVGNNVPTLCTNFQIAPEKTIWIKNLISCCFISSHESEDLYIPANKSELEWKNQLTIYCGYCLYLKVMNPDVYRGPWGGAHCRDSPVQTSRDCGCCTTECTAKDKYIEQLKELFKYNLPKGHVAAIFAESIQGVGGTVQFPKGYLQSACELVRENGGLFIADEVFI